MNKLILIFLIIGFTRSPSFAQKPITGFLYEMTYKRDTTNLDKSGKTMMLLMTDGVESLFMDYQVFVMDTLAKYHERIGTDIKTFFEINNGKVKASPFNFQVKKKGTDYKIYERFAFESYMYALEEKHKPLWKIHGDKKSIGNYSVQKATTTYAGRDYVAWFTEDIPISEGPYIFSGLPGLILKVTDSQGYFDFEWVETRKDKNFRVEPKIPKNSINITYEKFMKARQSYYNNPVQYLENNGTNVRAAGLADQIDENFKKRNNLIERKF